MTTRWIVFLCLFGFLVQHVCPQDVLPQDTTTTKQVSDKRDTPYHFKPIQFVVPTAMIGVGLLGLNKGWLEDQNHKLRDALQKNSPHHIKLDDYSQYAPLVALYGLDLVGVRGKHHIIDKTILTGTAYALMSASVNLLKWTTNERRPDGSARNFFPSGHTATAFVGAELLRREYWEVSPWIGVTGYAVATTTGVLRLYNNRHWLTDVIAGAGLGILSVEAAYWLYPSLARWLFRKRFKYNSYLSPYAAPTEKGMAMQISF